MEVTLHSHDISIPDRFRDYVNDKSDRAIALAEKAMNFQVKVTRENSSRKGPSVDIVELTMIGKGPVIRAEARNLTNTRRLTRLLITSFGGCAGQKKREPRTTVFTAPSRWGR